MNAETSSAARAAIRDRYLEQGYQFPVDVFSADEAAGFRRQLEALQSEIGDRQFGNRSQLNLGHVLFRFASDIVRDRRLLDIVEPILGPDLMVWGSTFFIKDANTADFVSWHQDLRYWGLDDVDGQVSAWLALKQCHRGERLHALRAGLTQGRHAGARRYLR